jgi:hypothetical protein
MRDNVAVICQRPHQEPNTAALFAAWVMRKKGARWPWPSGWSKKESAMAKGMNKQGKNVKKPKKEVAKTAVVLTPSTKNTVVISGGKSRD